MQLSLTVLTYFTILSDLHEFRIKNEYNILYL